MPGYFDLWTVLFSFVIASLAGFVAFESIEHTRNSNRPELWTATSGTMLGLGIWSMHFIGMLAWKPPFPLYYSLDRTVLSVLAAIAASWLAMRIIVQHKVGAHRGKFLLGALFVATGICGMHYIGMSALHFSPQKMWDPLWLLLSIVIAFAASYAALELLRLSLNDNFGIRRKLVASLVIGLAICGMHYAGMNAMMLHPGSICEYRPGSFSGVALARVGVGNALIFTICLLVASYQDKVVLLRRASEARFQAQEATRNAERLGAAGRIAAAISHEINNPLEAVTNLLYLAEQGNMGDEERGYIHLAQNELQRIAEITTHTLKFYRQQSAPALTDLKELLDSALVLFAKRLEAANITVVKNHDPRTPAIMCRAGEIRQVFANLIGNALDAMPHGGRLTLALCPSRNGAEFHITDTGVGIPEDLHAQVLEPFYTTKGVGGTGLGLSISAEIIQRHGGTIRLSSSTAPGKSGTSFYVYLPAALHE